MPTATAPPGPEQTVTLQYPNSDVVDVLRLYETLTGKKLVTDNFVQGKVNIFLSKPLPRDEAIKIIEMNLLMNGYSLVPAENNVVKVIGTGRNPRGAGVPIISDEARHPKLAITSSALSSSCATPIRSSSSRCSANIFLRPRRSLPFSRCPSPPALS